MNATLHNYIMLKGTEVATECTPAMFRHIVTTTVRGGNLDQYHFAQYRWFVANRPALAQELLHLATAICQEPPVYLQPQSFTLIQEL